MQKSINIMRKENLSVALSALTAGSQVLASILAGGIVGYIAGGFISENAKYIGLAIGVMLGLVAGFRIIYERYK
jgi:putative Mn2+ efflux pump MntP